jgi:hypothetical protein
MNPGRFHPGTDVLAPWGEDPYLYPAIVLGVDPHTQIAFVVYWNGQTAGVHDHQLRPLELRLGMQLESDLLGNNDYIPCMLLRSCGGALCMRNPNGHEVWSSFAKTRVAR